MEKLVSIAPADPARAATATAVSTVDPEALFHPVEHAILRKFLGRSPRRSDPQDLFQPVVPECDEDSPPYIGIDPELKFIALEYAVARLCLHAIQQRLPQYWSTRNGKAIPGRHIYSRSPRVIEPKPVYLFMINWADSAPGISWPVAYHATWIPGYARWVVTASADSGDAWGCADIATGSFRGRDIVAGAGLVICREWRNAHENNGQMP